MGNTTTINEIRVIYNQVIITFTKDGKENVISYPLPKKKLSNQQIIDLTTYLVKKSII